MDRLVWDKASRGNVFIFLRILMHDTLYHRNTRASLLYNIVLTRAATYTTESGMGTFSQLRGSTRYESDRGRRYSIMTTPRCPARSDDRISQGIRGDLKLCLVHSFAHRNRTILLLGNSLRFTKNCITANIGRCGIEQQVNASERILCLMGYKSCHMFQRTRSAAAVFAEWPK